MPLCYEHGPHATHFVKLISAIHVFKIMYATHVPVASLILEWSRNDEFFLSGLTEDGLEIQLQVNHLSPLLLTLELLPILLDTASSTGDGRIIFLSSRAHSGRSWNPETMNPQSEAQYHRMKTYGNTKLYNVSKLRG